MGNSIILKQELMKKIEHNIHTINTYKYSNEEAKCYDKKYRAILKPKYEFSEELFSCIVFDFDKLGPKNLEHGKENMDHAIHHILQYTRSLLPDAIITKYLSGDEYCLILPNIPIEKAELLMNTLIAFLNQKKEEYFDHKDFYDKENIGDLNTTYGLTATFHVMDNMENKNISDSLLNAFNVIKEKKKHRNDSQFSAEHITWNEIDKAIHHSVDEFFHDARTSANLQMDYSTFIKKILPNFAEFSTSALISRLSKEEISEEREPSEEFSLSFPEFSKEEAIELDTLVDHMDTSHLHEHSEKELMALYQKLERITTLLTTEPLSNMPSKSVFKKYICQQFSESDKSYQVIYISATPVKISNKIRDYLMTDDLLKDVSDKISTQFKSRVPIVKDACSFAIGDNIILDQGGGNFTLLIHQDEAIEEELLNKIMEEFNENNQSNDFGKLFLTYSNGTLPPHSTPNQVVEFVRSLRDDCSDKKDTLKILAFCGQYPLLKQDLMEAFTQDLHPALDIFLRSEATPYNLSMQRQFISHVIMACADKYKAYIARPLENTNTVQRSSNER